MKIVRLEAENVKRLVAVEVSPKGDVVIVGGDNAAGKTSLLDSIEMALAGGRSIPDRPIRRGAKKGHVVCELDEDGLVVTRTFTSKGSYLAVTGKDGKPVKSPQQMLDALVGRLTFDPLGFVRMDRGQQAETLKRLVGLDFSESDGERATAYEERKHANADVKRLAAQMEALPKHDDAPAEEVSIAELSRQLQAAQEHNRNRADLERQRREMEQVVGVARMRQREIARRIDQLNDEIAKAKAEDEKIEEEVAAKRQEGDALDKQLEAIKEIDCQPLHDQIGMAEETNREVRENARRAVAEKELAVARRQIQAMQRTLDKIDATKARMLADAKFPVEGLGFDEDGVTFGDLPFSQASSAEQLRVSVAMGFSMNPKLKILLIRDGSLLDGGSLKAISEMAAKNQGQVWIERVGAGKECSVVIEDGSVKGAEGGLGESGEKPKAAKPKPAAAPQPALPMEDAKDVAGTDGNK